MSWSSTQENVTMINLPGDSAAEKVEETERKVVELMQNKLNLASFTPEHIVAHGIGQFRASQNRPVVRLTTRKIRADIFRGRRDLKKVKSNIFINEDLTKINAQRLFEYKNHPLCGKPGPLRESSAVGSRTNGSSEWRMGTRQPWTERRKSSRKTMARICLSPLSTGWLAPRERHGVSLSVTVVAQVTGEER